jgi:hypothetical protein
MRFAFWWRCFLNVFLPLTQVLQWVGSHQLGTVVLEYRLPSETMNVVASICFPFLEAESF